MLPLVDGERIQSVLSTRDFGESKYLVFATRGGMVKKTELRLYNTPIKADGIIAININDGDELVAVRNVDEGDTVIMVSRSGQASRFEEAKGPVDGPCDRRREGHERRAEEQLRPGDGRRPPRPGPAGRDRERVRQRTAIDDYPIKGRGTMASRRSP